MTLNINSAANSTQSISTVFNGAEPRRALPRNEEATELPKGRGIRASAEVTDRLDDERRQQTNFRSATDKRSQQAIEAYQSQANEQRRSEVQSMLGVDLYA
ncbi:hypothetical protein [Rheinheimera baltica]|uniref:hypothetical protein n=1 Tax=Rheinheimera baltica TaxID=67576 RepID=UPI0027400189|nr:hypothetical protein [Rheinheimera baltica]MDP5141413.1 hypothetical protein [Rheinheimera baltica]MDP5189954.1 hypothetical protein [Rheinheimera baltica]